MKFTTREGNLTMKIKHDKTVKQNETFFEKGKIYLLNTEVVFDTKESTITYEEGTPVIFIDKDNQDEKRAIVVDSDKEFLSVSIEKLNKNSADKFLKAKEQLIYNVWDCNGLFSVILALFIAATIIIAINLSYTEPLDLLLSPLGYFGVIVAVLFFIWLLALLFIAVKWDDDYYYDLYKTYSLFNKNRKENMKELKKLKNINIDTLPNNFSFRVM